MRAPRVRDQLRGEALGCAVLLRHLPSEGEQGSGAGTARRRGQGAGGSADRESPHVAGWQPGRREVGARLAAIERRLAAAEAGVTRAEAERAGWRKVRDRLQAALARVGEAGGAVSAEKLTSAVRVEVGPQFAKVGKRLNAVEAAQAALRTELGKLAPPAAGATADDQMTLARRSAGSTRACQASSARCARSTRGWSRPWRRPSRRGSLRGPRPAR